MQRAKYLIAGGGSKFAGKVKAAPARVKEITVPAGSRCIGISQGSRIRSFGYAPFDLAPFDKLRTGFALLKIG